MWGVDMLFVVGGNGGNAGANAIQQKCAENDVHCSVIGVPKSIDNDILLIDKCFGFDTAVEVGPRAPRGAGYWLRGMAGVGPLAAGRCTVGVALRRAS